MAGKKLKNQLTWKLIRSNGDLVIDSSAAQDAMHMVVTMPSGEQLRVELFTRDERSGSQHGLRVSTIEGVMLVVPEASNTVKLLNETYVEQMKRSRARSR